MNVAIVTTLRDPGISLLSFLKYHFKIGFQHVFLFFDDPNDPAIAYANTFDNVTIVKNDEELERRWRETTIYSLDKMYYKYRNSEVMSRQVLNAEVAIKMCLDMQIDWLLHIDHDELFVPTAENIHDHFSRLSRERVDRMLYVNHEAIPEKDEVGDFFKDVTLFRKNPKVLDNTQRLFLSNLRQRHFLYYQNGKSAGRISKKLFSNGVHGFKQNNGIFSRLFNNVRGIALHQHISKDPCILHYPVCSLQNFLIKYRTLGQFNGKWFNKIDIKEYIPFHIESRNIVNGENEALIRHFYVENVMAKKNKDVCIEKRVYFRELKPHILISEGL